MYMQRNGERGSTLSGLEIYVVDVCVWLTTSAQLNICTSTHKHTTMQYYFQGTHEHTRTWQQNMMTNMLFQNHWYFFVFCSNTKSWNLKYIYKVENTKGITFKYSIDNRVQLMLAVCCVQLQTFYLPLHKLSSQSPTSLPFSTTMYRRWKHKAKKAVPKRSPKAVR